MRNEAEKVNMLLWRIGELRGALEILRRDVEIYKGDDFYKRLADKALEHDDALAQRDELNAK
jgi:hypothetical protein